MTDDRSLDRTLERAARSWIEVGPTAAPPHVVDAVLAIIDDTPQERDWFPWRLPRMTSSARVAALVAIGALILAGAFALLGPGSPGPNLPSPAPSTAPASAPAASAAITLSDTFVSPTYGYAVDFPTGWTTKPATKGWSTGAVNGWGSGFNDELFLTGAGLRFSGASQTLDAGQTADAWLTAYAAGSDRATWKPISIDGKPGYLTADGVAAAGGTIAPGGRMFDAVVIDGDRAYNFNMDGHVDRAVFDQFIASVKLDPAGVGALPPLDGTYVSPWYGYRLRIASTWTTKAATTHWHGVDNSPPAVDEITITGTDTTISIASQALKGQTLAQFLVPFHANTTANVPAGCDGGDPSTWASTAIGSETGRWYELCNAAEAVVAVGGRVYAFTWSNATFQGSEHLSLASWLKVLETMTFEPTKAVDR